MIHGDLKGVCSSHLGSFFQILPGFPIKANILIDQTGHARLADFGLLTIISDPRNIMSSSSCMDGGTIRWMSPELIDPQRFGFEKSHPTKSSDCYALGMVIYETISGNQPFHKYKNHTVSLKVLQGEHPPQGARFTETLWKMLELCWMSQPDDRPSIEAVLQCLEEIPNLPELASPGVNGDIGKGSDDRSSTSGSYLVSVIWFYKPQTSCMMGCTGPVYSF